MQAPSYSEIKAKSDEELVAKHDIIVPYGAWGHNDLLNELARRDGERQTATIRRLTWLIAGLTLLNVVVAVAIWIKA